ncbi:uncharacterized protein ATNIH1004_001960 [Aspergillus tanneri]|uniref:Uncharacterized protein n=1 Tax=Aspergillus tanneri TaxID=1220188 RepID=A0A5M9M3N3_9EURO|nr:uncharacterized protein ATNIH1004_001960 [Aspergillus tanneri]KAA8641358.1 hypothetical protein ATNIH1004_001960 [Aspergillus tanneri]
MHLHNRSRGYEQNVGLGASAAETPDNGGDRRSGIRQSSGSQRLMQKRIFRVPPGITVRSIKRQPSRDGLLLSDRDREEEPVYLPAMPGWISRSRADRAMDVSNAAEACSNSLADHSLKAGDVLAFRQEVA